MRLATQERYERDQVFAYIVDTLYSMLCVNHDKLQFTPTEMREAAMLACMKYENTHLRPMFVVESTNAGFGAPALFGGGGSQPLHDTVSGASFGRVDDNAKTRW